MKLDEAIRAALEYEGGVHRTYQEAAERSTDPTGKRVFQTLCDEEMGHVRYLRERLDEWQKTGKVQVKKLETSIPTRASIDASLQKLRQTVTPKPAMRQTPELEFLQKALEVEIQASDFYRDMVSKLDGDGQRLFARFVEIEEGHKAIVQAEINAVSGLGYWFDTAEFNVEAG